MESPSSKQITQFRLLYVYISCFYPHSWVLNSIIHKASPYIMYINIHQTLFPHTQIILNYQGTLHIHFIVNQDSLMPQCFCNISEPVKFFIWWALFITKIIQTNFLVSHVYLEKFVQQLFSWIIITSAYLQGIYIVIPIFSQLKWQHRIKKEITKSVSKQ